MLRERERERKRERGRERERLSISTSARTSRLHPVRNALLRNCGVVHREMQGA